MTDWNEVNLRLVSIYNCRPGMVIAKPIYSEQGLVLIAEGTSLTESAIEALKRRGISFVYVEDKRLADVELGDDIPIELRIEATNAIAEIQEQFFSNDERNERVFEGVYVDKLRRALKNLMSEINSMNNVINLLTNMYTHDSYTFSHSTNVTLYTLAMAANLGFNEKQMNEIGIGSMMHDIGKCVVPKHILNKPGPLEEDEFELVKRHTEYGFEILRKDPSVSLLSAHCALQHHEKLDGTGYPRGLKGDEIHPYGKILAVADVFDALTSNRPYRKAMLPHEAMEILYGETYTHFDPKYVKTFQRSVATYPVGLTVKLNTGETGVVVHYEMGAPNRPTVRVLNDPTGDSVDKPYEIDLAKHPSIMITECDAILT